MEINISLKPYSVSVQSSSDTWDDFVVYFDSTDGRWTEHSRGLVSIHQDRATFNSSNNATVGKDIHGLNDFNSIGFNGVNVFNGVNGVNVVAPKTELQGKGTKSLAEHS